MGGHSQEYSNRPVTAVCKCLEILLRISAALLSVAGLIIMVKNKQVIHMMVDTVPLTLEAKPSYVTAFMYLIYANGLVAVYSAVVVLALLISFIGRARSGKFFAGIVFFLDQAVTYVLVAAAAASTEVAYIAKRGNDKVSWSEVCSTFNHYCSLVGVSLVLSFLSIIVMALVSILSARRLFNHPVPLAEKMTANHVQEP